MFGECPKLGQLLTAKPLLVFLCLSAASLLLIIPSVFLNIASIPLQNGKNVGFLHSFSWLFAYPLALPLTFALLAGLGRLAPERVEQILARKVIREVTESGAVVAQPDEYFACLRKVMEPGSRAVVSIALALTVVLIATDTAHLFRAVVYLEQSARYQNENSNHKPYEILDWTFAYAFPHQLEEGLVSGRDQPSKSWTAPSKRLNLAFDVLAWTFESSYIFLGSLWVFMYGWFLKKFADLMIGKQTKYAFFPQLGFQERNLGLKPIGVLYDIYLSAVVILGVMAAALRLQYIPINCMADYPSLGSYVNDLWQTSLNPKSLNPRIFAFGCLNKANVWYITCYGVALFVIIYFPMIRLRNYLRQRIDGITETKNDEMEQAIREGNEAKKKSLEWEIEALKRGQVWPNGDNAAFLFLVIIGSLYAIAVTPGLIPVAAVIGTGIGAWKLVAEALFKKVVPTTT